jgi:hypothetical protein
VETHPKKRPAFLQWGNWMFSVADRPQPGALRFACQNVDGSNRRPCTTQGPSEQVMVVGGWQEARGGCSGHSNGALEWALPSFKWPFFVENVRELCDSPREWFFDEALRRLYYRPQNDTVDPSTLEFVAAVSGAACKTGVLKALSRGLKNDDLPRQARDRCVEN